MVKIAYCAGHGHNTPGKRSPIGEREWDFNNKVVVAFEKEIKKYGNVSLLRTDDRTGKTDVPLNTRTNKANSWKADLYISFHHNALTAQWGSWTGVETYVYTGNMNANSGKIAKAVHPAVVKAYGLRDRGVKEMNLHIVRMTNMPAILIEGGFMDSTIDIKKLRNDKVLANAGVLIAQAVAKYYKLKLTSGNTTTKPSTPSKPKPSTKGNLYRVRKTWKDEKSQVGAFSNLKNAKDAVKKNKGYKVFDANGNQVSPLPASVGTAVITTSTLNVRDHSSLDSNVVRKVKKNDKVTVYKVYKEFYLIGEGEWISNKSGKYAKYTKKKVSETKKTMYRVRKTWKDAKSQIGAYTSLKNAKEMADKNKGYKVFDENGKTVYPKASSSSMYRVRKTWKDAKSQIGAYKELANAKALVDKNPSHKVFDNNGKVVYQKKK